MVHEFGKYRQFSLEKQLYLKLTGSLFVISRTTRIYFKMRLLPDILKTQFCSCPTRKKGGKFRFYGFVSLYQDVLACTNCTKKLLMHRFSVVNTRRNDFEITLKKAPHIKCTSQSGTTIQPGCHFMVTFLAHLDSYPKKGGMQDV